jgi:very-short-patch-repair endonuclease
MRRPHQYRGGFQFAGRVNLARQLRQELTPAEELLWKLLRNRRLFGVKFRRQHQIGSFITDFYSHEAQLVIECDGPVHEENEQWQHDQNRDAYLISLGLTVLRFNNDQILNEIDAVLRQILVTVHERNASRPHP